MFKATISVIFFAFFLGATIHPSPTTTTDACPLQNSHHDGAQLAEAGHEGRRCHQGAAAQRASSVPNDERLPAETWSHRSIQQRQLQTSGDGLSGLFDFLFGCFSISSRQYTTFSFEAAETTTATTTTRRLRERCRRL